MESFDTKDCEVIMESFNRKIQNWNSLLMEFWKVSVERYGIGRAS